MVDVRFRQVLLDDELLLGLVGVNRQIVCASIGTTDAFDPTVRGFDFEIPTVLDPEKQKLLFQARAISGQVLLAEA